MTQIPRAAADFKSKIRIIYKSAEKQRHRPERSMIYSPTVCPSQLITISGEWRSKPCVSACHIRYLRIRKRFTQETSVKLRFSGVFSLLRPAHSVLGSGLIIHIYIDYPIVVTLFTQNFEISTQFTVF